LLIHLIKQEAEKRNTRSWKNLILNSIEGIYSSEELLEKFDQNQVKGKAFELIKSH
jgi:hypothetical protein